MQNHTATHVMNWALREVLGEHVQQKGSLVDPEKTRFDFSHPKPLAPEEIVHVERLVNDKIDQHVTVYDEPVPQEQALKINGLRAVFGEKYPDTVRVLSIGVPVRELVRQPDSRRWRDVSIEFCGGTHVKNTAEIERFAIVSEEPVAKGIRRVVAITGQAARDAEQRGMKLVERAQQIKTGPSEQVAAGVAELQEALADVVVPVRLRIAVRQLIGELQQIVRKQQKAAAADAGVVVRQHVSELLKQAAKIGDTTVVVGEMPDVPIDQLKNGADSIKQKCGSAAVLLGVRAGEKAVLLAAMTPDLIKKGLKAGDLVKAIAGIVAGGGGGPPTMAQAGGKNPDALPDALAAGREWISARL
jgi:alanyl-tRNA synthetase